MFRLVRLWSFVGLRSSLRCEVSIHTITKLTLILGDRADRLLSSTTLTPSYLLLDLIYRLLHLLNDGALFLDDKIIFDLHVVLPLDDLLQIVNLPVKVAVVADVLLVGIFFVIAEGIIVVGELAYVFVVVYLAHNDLLIEL